MASRVENTCPATGAVLRARAGARSGLSAGSIGAILVGAALAVIAFAIIPRTALAGPPTAAAAVRGGIDLGGAYEGKTFLALTSAQQNAVMAQIAKTGATWVRVNYADQTTAGSMNTSWDPMIEAATAKGLKVDAILSVPTWAEHDGGDVNVSTTSAYMIQAAAHLATLGVHTVEILNEPNLDTTAAKGITVSSYVSLLKEIYRPIHQNDPDATILAGGSGLTTSSTTALSPQDYLTQMYADGAGGYFDDLVMHPYVYPYLPDMSASWNPWTFMPQLHSIMSDHGDGAKRIWYTEFGAPTSGTASPVSGAVEALSYTQAFAMARTWSWSGPLFAFNWEDSADGGFGLNTSSGSPKAALASYDAAVAGTAPVAVASLPGSHPSPAITSAATTTMTARDMAIFTVTSADPNATISESGPLPSGISFNQDVLWGTPEVGTGGTYKLTFTPTDGSSVGPAQTFALVVHQAPIITSSTTATFRVGASGTFRLTAASDPAATFTLTGSLPSGLSFSDGVISGTPAAGTQGSYRVTVGAANGISPAASLVETILVNTGVPAVTAVSPASGPADGGTQVTISGANLSGITSVKFGTVAATSFHVVSSTQVLAESPTEAAGAHNVIVSGPGGTSPTSGSTVYTFLPPTVTSLSPSGGPVTGGTTVTITGTNLGGATRVMFGNAVATSFHVVSPTEVVATAPAQGAGSHNVTVTNVGGTSATKPGDVYTY
jgi:IPT/TIG domain-containing protein/putative Ig domain-containing protein